MVACWHCFAAMLGCSCKVSVKYFKRQTFLIQNWFSVAWGLFLSPWLCLVALWIVPSNGLPWIAVMFLCYCSAGLGGQNDGSYGKRTAGKDTARHGQRGIGHRMSDAVITQKQFLRAAPGSGMAPLASLAARLFGCRFCHVFSFSAPAWLTIWLTSLCHCGRFALRYRPFRLAKQPILQPQTACFAA